MRHISDDERRARLAWRHHLLPETRLDDPAKLTDDLVALHSSDPATVYLSLLVRMASPDVAAIDAALYEDRSLVRLHAMRRTMWVMTRAVARRAHAAATEKLAADERKRTAKALRETADVAEPEAWLADAKQEVVELVAEAGGLDTRTVGGQLPHLVFPVEFGTPRNPATLNAHTKVLQGAGFDGLLVRGRPNGGWTSSEYIWAATEAWLGEAISGADARQAPAELADHYLRRFGPATETDVKWWFGWTATVTRRALADAGAEEVALDGEGTGWIAAGDDASPDEPEPWVRLLPGLDATTMGWKERHWYLDQASIAPLFDRFGNPGPTVWADGRIVGGWVQRPDGEIALDLHAELPKRHRALLDDAIDELRAAVGDVVVKPRFPSPNQKQLLA